MRECVLKITRWKVTAQETFLLRQAESSSRRFTGSGSRTFLSYVARKVSITRLSFESVDPSGADQRRDGAADIRLFMRSPEPTAFGRTTNPFDDTYRISAPFVKLIGTLAVRIALVALGRLEQEVESAPAPEGAFFRGLEAPSICSKTGPEEPSKVQGTANHRVQK